MNPTNMNPTNMNPIFLFSRNFAWEHDRGFVRAALEDA